MTNQMTDVNAALNAVLADSFALYLKTKNFHWHVSGPHFRDYHLLLDEQATQILASTDLDPYSTTFARRDRPQKSADEERGAVA